MREGLKGADIVMMLRLQMERMTGSFLPSQREYFHFYGLDREKLALAKPGALVMHPGPMNRGVEIDSAIADDIDRSLIHEQVEMGVAVRMAVLDALARQLPNAERTIMSARTAFINARLIDPDTSFDATGALLVEDGKIADLGPRLFNDGKPANADIVDCARQRARPRPHRHARLHRRTRRRTPRDTGLRRRVRRSRRRHLVRDDAGHRSRHRRRGARRLHHTPRRREREGATSIRWRPSPKA